MSNCEIFQMREQGVADSSRQAKQAHKSMNVFMCSFAYIIAAFKTMLPPHKHHESEQEANRVGKVRESDGWLKGDRNEHRG